MRIGLDFDNTLVTYGSLFVECAKDRGWLAGRGSDEFGKNAVRDWVRGLEDGEIKWQKLQAEVYGPRLGEAGLMAGVAEFLQIGKRLGVEFCVVSHKTRFAQQDLLKKYDLQVAALAWMEQRGFFREEGFAMAPEQIYFALTRAEKIARIASLGCDCFIDDSVEIFADPTFPAGTKRWLIDPYGQALEHGVYRVFTSWDAMALEAFGG